jgi:hypothetical protein
MLTYVRSVVCTLVQSPSSQVLPLCLLFASIFGDRVSHILDPQLDMLPYSPFLHLAIQNSRVSGPLSLHLLSSDDQQPRRKIEDLPVEVITNIVTCMDDSTAAFFGMTCKTLYRVVMHVFKERREGGWMIIMVALWKMVTEG